MQKESCLHQECLPPQRMFKGGTRDQEVVEIGTKVHHQSYDVSYHVARTLVNTQEADVSPKRRGTYWYELPFQKNLSNF